LHSQKEHLELEASRAVEDVIGGRDEIGPTRLGVKYH
jgi:hypothetical protein